MLKQFVSVLAITTITLLSACGGGSDTSPATTPGVAAYEGKYTGSVTGISNSADSGTFEVTADSTGNVSGTTIVKNLPWTLSGTVDDNGALNIGLYSGTWLGHNWVGTINKSTGAISGTWSHANGDGVNGTFSGSKR